MTGDLETSEKPFGYEPPSLETWVFPRRYQRHPMWRVLALCFSLALWVAAAAWPVWRPGDHGGWWLPFGLVVVGLLILVEDRRYGIVLHTDAVEVTGLWHSRRLAVAQIEGWRAQAQPFGLRVWRLVARSGAGRDVRFDWTLRTDAAFAAWMARLADLDGLERDAARRAVLDDTAWGATPESRWRALRRYQWVTRVLVLVVSVLVIVSLFRRRDTGWPLFVAAVLPLVILGLATALRPRLRLDWSRHDLRPSLASLLTLVVVALVVRQFSETELEHWSLVLIPSLLVGGVLGAWAWAVARSGRLDGATRWPLLPLLAGYAASVLVVVNGSLDGPAARVDRSAVTSKQWSGRRWPVFQLVLDAVDAGGLSGTLQVPLATYNSVSPGETVCVHRHDGRLGWAWTEVRPCAGPATAAAGPWPDPLYRALKSGAFGTERQGPLLQRLRERQFNELNEQLDSLQRRFEQGEVDDLALLVTYRDFYDPDPDLDGLFDAWVEQTPGTYAAYLARGIHRKFQAERLHAAGFERWVSPQFNVEAVTDRQIDDLQHSVALTARPVLSYVHLMDAASHRRQSARLRELLDQGLALAPGSRALTRKYLSLINGDLDAMAAFVDECRRNAMPAATLASLDTILLLHRGFAKRRAKDIDGALVLFKQAASLDAYGEDHGAVLREVAYIYTERQQNEEAAAWIRRAIEADPVKSGHHAFLASVLWQLGQRQESVAETRRAAELGLADSQANLGEQLLRGELLPRDEAEAAKWLRRAAAGGSERARQLLREHPSWGGL